MSIVRFQIDNYQITKGASVKTVFDGNVKIVRGIVGCYGDDYILALNFTDKAEDLHKGFFDQTRKYASLFLPVSDMPVVIDMLRNEKPIYAHVDTKNPECSTVSTLHEPVGEGE